LKHNFAIHEQYIRSKNYLPTEIYNTSLFQKRVINTGVKLYKYLPPEIKNWKILTALEHK
jgi:hypothetical protein